jgi:hypothetical protein
MCMISCSIVAVVVMVFLGYIAMWSASQANTPAGISSFGKVMAIILFVIAGFILVFGIAGRRDLCGPMMGKMYGQGNASMMPGPEGGPAGHKPRMMKPGDEKGKPGMPPAEKQAEPAK